MKRLLITLFSIFLSAHCFAQKEFYIKEVLMECSIVKGCERYKNRIYELKHQTLEIAKIQEKTKNFLAEGLLNDLRLQVFEINENEAKIIIKMDPKRRVGKISIGSNISDLNVQQLYKIFPYKTDDIYDAQKGIDAQKILENFLLQKKIVVEKITILDSYHQDKVNFNIQINIKKVIRIFEIVVDCQDDSIRKKIVTSFLKAKGKIYDLQEIKIDLEQISNDYKDNGYYNFQITVGEYFRENRDVKIILSVNLGEIINFHIQGNHVLDRKEVMGFVKSFVRTNQGKFSFIELERMINEKYEEYGVYNTNVKTKIRAGVNKLGRKYTNYYLKINEGKKVPILTHIYYGNEKWSDRKLDSLYEKKASTMASRGFVDRNYLQQFSNIIKESYLREGHVFAEVSEPKIVFADNYQSADVEYVIREKQQVILEKININNLDTDTAIKIKKVLINKEGAPVNLVELQTDLQTVLNKVRNEGYYFADIVNVNDPKLLQFDLSQTSAILNIDVKTGKKLIFHEVVVSGNITTKTEVILREVNLKQGDLITHEVLEKIKDYLLSTGLFSSIKILPVIQSRKEDSDLYYTNLFIEIHERDFGSLEIAPGFRTDIGVKLATSASYNNLWGMNRSLSLKLETNQRLDFDSFDERRKKEEKRLLEYNAKLGYEEPYIFNYPVAFDGEVSQIRRRYYSFDADISRISTLFTKLFFSRKLSTSLRYKLEEIKPFDVTDLKDQDDYRIGSITPVVTLDFRDRTINPREGSHLMLSCEYAHPAFLSQKTSELEINFMKLVSRNKFYYSIGEVTIAAFVSMGFQQNLASDTDTIIASEGRARGYIPSREVFRLDGTDTVRGFDDTEINRLDDAQDSDIAEYVVGDKAFFSNYKIEPRFIVAENIMIGTFFDAGRVYVNSFEPLKVRTAVGLSLKILTPVGTLDFDYGVKLKRESYSGGERDSFGRFHLSIGYF
ncbi:MAG: hypothetical protein A2381_10765 [Bdellovibrionales bacterium RIFOXYB1_FULL_37_110]|nr:MAG: hypothetical protein A2181_06905 [Bdellovibrionales bacterium RIFOXYA1_FULL_38_20]OFZ51146.1 MAG: hypothetical protein A2417_17750 [Bdellovibrionales bacterium RIFOXYC1_FULL_37_79]OFZ58525.1 MAG: hypothetical protein A2328_07075 [Bdellovibrionales bacterium RIFOXYB2_FULL_36_6]OFZ61252.1 MAG: hypothetical protein A2381_10765 [Bdellovibrionales bacterium RIFOXYB1_FULL_37_110]OFZ62115.1 MAG: hypothetical protein A2577_14340 [Bdellovibrionales bacterium RIFOXYD1_FULL_36_51]